MANEENKHGIENSQSKKAQQPIRAKKPNGGGPPDPLTAPGAPRKRASPQDTVIKTNYQPPLDAIDLAGLYEDRGQGDPLAQTRTHHIRVGKPRSFAMIPKNAAFRRILNFYFLKKEGTIDEKPFLVADEMLGLMEGEARPAVLTTCVLRDGSIELWPLKQPREGESDNTAWSTAMDVARDMMKGWAKPKWKGGKYETRWGSKGYAAPDFTKLIPLDEQIQIAFREEDVIRDENHPVYREEILGEIPDEKEDESGDDGEA